MNRDDRHDKFDGMLDEALEGIRGTELDEATSAAAAERVWQRVRDEAAAASAAREAAPPTGGDPLQVCGDFQALIPAYITDSLSEARKLLLEDHVRDCVACRKAVKRARSGRAVPASAAKKGGRRRRTEWSWAVAAAALLFVGLLGFNVDLGIFSVRAGGMITITQVDGELYRVSEAGAIPVAAGETFQLAPGEGIRTARGGQALLELPDGSQLEMRERSELAVYERKARFGGEWLDSTIELERGAVIIEASDQGSGHLYVDTPDKARVAVTGTVFSVSTGVQGSRVSVFEGEVQVRHDGETDVLNPGDQVGTARSVRAVPLDREIAWSAKVDQHLALLEEVTKLGRDIDALLEEGQLRYSTRLLERAPTGTVLYAALPNISGALAEAYAEVQERLNTNEVLREWWGGQANEQATDEMNAVFERIRNYGSQFGDEVVLTLQADAGQGVRAPLFLAELDRPGTFVDMLMDDVREAGGNEGRMPGVQVYEGLPPVLTDNSDSSVDGDMFLWIHDGVLCATPDKQLMFQAATMTANPAANEFVGGAFHGRLDELYADGVEWLLGVDLARMIDLDSPESRQDETLAKLGLLDIKHLILERRPQGDRFINRGVLSFDQPRRGVASWLAEPAPMGSLEFLSPDAGAVMSLGMRTPSALFDELISLMGVESAELETSLEQFRNETGVDLQADIIDALGGEFTFALDGPVLPNPSWKFIIEVYDAQRLQRSLETLVEKAANEIQLAGGSQGTKKAADIVASTSGGRTYYQVSLLEGAFSAVHYTFVDGYMVAGSSRALIDRALANRRSGFTLPASPRFQALLPQDNQIHFSGIFYTHMAPTFGGLFSTLNRMAGQVGPEQRAMIDSILQNTDASLTYIYAERDKITAAATSNEGLFTTGLKMMFNMRALGDMHELLEGASRTESGS